MLWLPQRMRLPWGISSFLCTGWVCAAPMHSMARRVRRCHLEISVFTCFRNCCNKRLLLTALRTELLHSHNAVSPHKGED